MDPKDIAILTPYNAQAAEISKCLAQLGVTGLTVCSITKSQGEAAVGAGRGSRPGWGRGSHRAGGGASPRPAPAPGSEWRYVLVSTVRSCPESDLDLRPTKSWLKRFLGFVVDPNQVNVAITRAQEGLCIVGECRGGVGRAAPGVGGGRPPACTPGQL